MSDSFLFVHSDVDDAGLSPLQFRLLAHLSRRAGVNGMIYSSIANMARVCGLAPNTVKIALRELRTRNIVVTDQREGQTALRRVNSPSEWKMDPARKTTGVENQPGSEYGAGGSVKNDPPPSTKNVPERLSKQGNPKKGNPIPAVAEEIYLLYPRKVARRKALAAIAKALKKTDADTIKKAIAVYQFSDELKFIPHPATWFNEERWADESLQRRHYKATSRPAEYEPRRSLDYSKPLRSRSAI